MDQVISPEEQARQLAEQLNQEATERIKKESNEKVSLEDAKRKEAIFFEDAEKVRLRDGNEYMIPPLKLKNARKVMKLIGTISSEVIIVNFLPTGDDVEDEKRIETLYEILKICLEGHAINDEFIEEYIDLRTASKIIEYAINVNGLKK